MIVRVGSIGSYALNKLDGHRCPECGTLRTLKGIINEVFFKGVINKISLKFPLKYFLSIFGILPIKCSLKALFPSILE